MTISSYRWMDREYKVGTVPGTDYRETQDAIKMLKDNGHELSDYTESKTIFEEVKKTAGKSVEIPGPIFSESELIQEYKEAELFVYPSQAKKGETFGLAILEAMSFGCVPIVSSLPCFEDFIKPGQNGLCFDESSDKCDEELAKCLQELMSESSLSGYAHRAETTAKNYFVEKIAKRYIEDFTSLLEGG